jgi:tricorn protease
VWTEAAGGILFNQDGRPAKLEPSGKLESYSFTAAQESSRSGWLRAGFYAAWLTMREVWYDERMGNRNWDEIRRKYAQVAGDLQTAEGLATVVELMLGELNGSHLGFTPESGPREPSVEGWRDETAHLGVRFVEDHRGPGLLVRDVIPDGPADREQSQLKAGDLIVSIDGKAVDPAMDLTTILNGPLARDIVLHIVRTTKREGDKEEKKEIDIALRPIVYATARSLLYDHWLEHNRQAVEKASGGKLGYLHIRAMDMGSFYEFERQLYNVGYGREGLVIDVRDNGGGSTTDLLLTALTQPKHAITVPRGGGPGYPHDRIVFASWSKPIIVLCNQNSYSNAEIFSHAIKTLGRGKVVGVQTAGGVVSTGSARINDVGRLRVPFRGWFLLNDGKDMELNGCMPDEVVWPAPKELPMGQDRQLDKAVEMLLQEVSKAPTPKSLRYATEK